MNRKMHEVEVTEAEKVGQQGGRAVVAEINQEAAVGVALAEFGAACEAVIAKRRKVYERFRELDEKMKGPGLERITMPEADPFDLDALKKAAMETGSPQEGKEWVAAVRALASSAYRDTEFFGACLVVLSECGGYLRQKDAELAETLADLEAERDRIVAEYNRKVAAARDSRPTGTGYPRKSSQRQQRRTRALQTISPIVLPGIRRRAQSALYMARTFRLRRN